MLFNLTTFACFECVTLGICDRIVRGLFRVISLLGVAVRFLLLADFVGVWVLDLGVSGVLDLVLTETSVDESVSVEYVNLPLTALLLETGLVSVNSAVLRVTFFSIEFNFASIALTRCWTPTAGALFRDSLDSFELFGVCVVFLAITRGVLETDFEDVCERVELLVGVFLADTGLESWSELSSRDNEALPFFELAEVLVLAEWPDVDAIGSCDDTNCDDDDGSVSSDRDTDLLGLSSELEISLHWTWSDEVDGGGLASLTLSLEVDTSESESISRAGEDNMCLASLWLWRIMGG